MNINVGKVKEIDTAAASAIIIRPPRGWIPIDLRELWAYRELLYFLVWRDVKVRYKQTVFGFSWAHWVAGVTAGSARWVALRYYLKAILYHPPTFLRNLGKWQAALPVILPKSLLQALLWVWHVPQSILARGRRLLKGRPAGAEG